MGARVRQAGAHHRMVRQGRGFRLGEHGRRGLAGQDPARPRTLLRELHAWAATIPSLRGLGLVQIHRQRSRRHQDGSLKSGFQQRHPEQPLRALSALARLDETSQRAGLWACEPLRQDSPESRPVKRGFPGLLAHPRRGRRRPARRLAPVAGAGDHPHVLRRNPTSREDAACELSAGIRGQKRRRPVWRLHHDGGCGNRAHSRRVGPERPGRGHARHSHFGQRSHLVAKHPDKVQELLSAVPAIVVGGRSR